jgi:hypothetical protein
LKILLTPLYFVINEIKEQFYKPGTRQISRNRVVSAIIFTLIIAAYGIYSGKQKLEADKERQSYPLYTVGFTIRQYKKF